MRKAILLISILLLLLFSANSCFAIWCFICTSPTTPGCGDDFRIQSNDGEVRSWCEGSSCIKRRGERSSGSVRRIEIERSCVTRTSEDCFTEYKNNLKYYSCVCNENFCNSSRRKSSSKYLVILISAGVAYFMSSMRILGF